MSTVEIDPRVSKRHPEIDRDDITATLKGMLKYQLRNSGEWLAVGFDKRGRFIELVYLYREDLDSFYVYHAMTPPSAKVLRELGLVSK